MTSPLALEVGKNGRNCKMPKCPRCGSTAQVKVTGTNFVEDGWEITLYHHYECGCGCRFYGTSVFHCQEQYEIIEED